MGDMHYFICIYLCQWLVLAAYGNPSFTAEPQGFLCGWNGKRIGEPEVRLVDVNPSY